MMLSVALVAHLLAATVWVGGMFLMHVCVRPNLPDLDPPVRLTLLHGIFKRFFPWVMMAVVALPLSGYTLIIGAYGGFAGMPIALHIMHALGLVMFALFLHMYFAPWRRMRKAVAETDWQAAGAALGQIRMIVLINLVLGLITVAMGGLARYV